MTTGTRTTGAALAMQLADQYCAGDAAAGTSCRWYHGPWQYFRRLGVVSTAAVHEQFLLGALQQQAQQHRDRQQATAAAPPLRVLISGSTDHAMLALVLQAAAGHPVAVTLADRCPTPLRWCEHYFSGQKAAVTAGSTLDTWAGDLLEFTTDTPFDLICTHAFMGYFDDQARATLVQRWHALLRPGGSLVTLQRLRPDHPPGLARFSAAQAAAFRDQVWQEACARRAELDITPEQLAACAAEFAERFVSHPVRSFTGLQQLFVDAGFALPVFSCEAIGRRTPGELSGPSVPAHADYVHIVATRH